jgi:hypothetical protein
VWFVDPIPELVLAVTTEDGDVGVRLVDPEPLYLLVVVEIREVEEPPLDELGVGATRKRLVDVGLSEVVVDFPEYLSLYRVVGDELSLISRRSLGGRGTPRFGVRTGLPVRPVGTLSLLVRILPLELLVSLGGLAVAAHENPPRRKAWVRCIFHSRTIYRFDDIIVDTTCFLRSLRPLAHVATSVGG